MSQHNYTRPESPTPNAVVENGKFNFGTFREPIANVNMLDAEQPFSNPLLNGMKYYRLKEWQAFQMGNEDYFIMVAIYNAKVLSLAQFIVHDIKNNVKTKYEQKAPFWKIKVAQGLYDTVSEYDGGKFFLRAENDLKKGTIRISVKIKDFQGLPKLKGEFEGFHDDKVAPQVVVMPFAENRGMYSHKCLMPLRGTLKFGDRVINFQPNKAHMIIDDHKGYYPYTMHYDWITGATVLPEGRLFGFNLTDNQVKDQMTYNENCMWLNSELHPLPPVKVTRPEGMDVGKVWYIKDEFGKVDLTFTPTVNTRVDINALVIRSDYHGPYGTFSGTIMANDGELINLNKVFGMGEKFYLRA